MKTLHRYITYIFSTLLLVSMMSCDKDKDGENGPQTAALLANGTWIGTTAIEDGQDMTQQYADQNQDIRKLEIVFNTNGSVTSTYNQGRPEVGTWKLVNDNESILFMENTPNEMEGKIIMLTESDFRIKNDVINLELRFVKKQ